MDELEFYASPGRMTDLRAIEDRVANLPADVPGLCRVVQGLIVHPFWASRYGVGGVAERDEELQIREAASILEKVLEIDDRPLADPREPSKRVLGNCRDFTTVATALLRHKGVAARGRCGFATYFQAGKYVDHWVVQWWDGARWMLTDPQLDAFQLNAIAADFDALDVPCDRFIDAGRAWHLYRAGEADGDDFGILDMWGPWFIRGNVSRDLASLNKVEMLPWDAWGDLDATPTDEETDRVAAVAASAEFDAVRALYESDERLRVGDEITSFRSSGPVKVRL